jgi:hypothetical protein
MERGHALRAWHGSRQSGVAQVALGVKREPAYTQIGDAPHEEDQIDCLRLRGSEPEETAGE